MIRIGALEGGLWTEFESWLWLVSLIETIRLRDGVTVDRAYWALENHGGFSPRSNFFKLVESHPKFKPP